MGRERHIHPDRMTALIPYIGLVGALVASCVVSSRVEAQNPRRVDLSADSVARLTSGLSAESRDLVDTYLTGEAGAAGSAIRRLASYAEPTAVPFVLAVLPQEPTASLRASLSRRVTRRVYMGEWPDRAGVEAVLLDRVRRDPDVYVVETAVGELKALTSSGAATRAVLAERMAQARAANDTAMLRVVLEEDEDIAHVLDGVYAPPFVRTPPPPFVVAPAGRAVRVLAFGDFGRAHLPLTAYDSTSGRDQLELAEVMRTYHTRNRFTFGITTGDNFYDTSFPSPTDPRWKISWEEPYGPLGIPFYASLGNHDWAEGAGPIAQYAYGLTSRSWKLPAFYYTYVAGPAQFFVINTSLRTPRQIEWLRSALAASRAKWKIVYGHYPAYEQTNYATGAIKDVFLPIFKEFKIDMYLAGHAHNLQHWHVDGIDFVVTGGGGADNHDLGDTTENTVGRRFVAARHGFTDLKVSDSAIELRLVGYDESAVSARVGIRADAKRKREPKVLYQYTREK